jgi:CheY-like chemotaxis protein
MTALRKVLLADPDLSSVRALTRALRSRGYQVQYARDGSRALEVAVLRHPDVILFDEEAGLIGAQAFAQILKTNPRTSGIPVVVTTRTSEHDHQRRYPDGTIQKPFNLDEVLARIDHLARRAEAARELRGDDQAIEGGLAQLPLTDLLQILAMNRRSGRLALSLGSERGEIALGEGRPVGARHGEVEGEKALFRLLGWREGTFAFHPGAPGPVRIKRGMEDALMEGMRQTDERHRLLASLPPPARLLVLRGGAPEPIDPHPVMAEVLRLLEQPRTVQELQDLAQAGDLEVLGTLTTLLEKGLVEALEAAVGEPAPLLGASEVHALRSRLMRGKPARNTLVAKVVLCGSGPRAARWFLNATPGLVPLSSQPLSLKSSFGTVGRLVVSDVLRVDFVVVPPADAARPLWRPFLATALGALMLEDTAPVLALARFCAFDLRLPLVVVAGRAGGDLMTTTTVPESLRGAPGGVVAVRSDLTTAVRSLLLIALQSGNSDSPGSLLARLT